MNYGVFFIYKRKRYATLVNKAVFESSVEALKMANNWNLLWKKKKGIHIVAETDLPVGHEWKTLKMKEIPKLNFKELSERVVN